MKDAFNGFIQKQFEDNGYSVLGFVHEDVLFLKNNEHEDFWLVAVGLESYQNQDVLFEEMQASFYKEYPLAVKNTSLLILYDTDADLLESNTLIEIENDPLYFKKYVLCYTAESYNKIMDMLKGDTVAGLAMNNDIFTNMMNESVFGPASLLYSIMHKLPFIPLKQTTVDKEAQAIFNSEESNANELISFLDALPDEDENLNQAVENLLKIEGNGEIDS